MRAMLLEKEQQTMKNVIEADNICKSFGKNHVLKGLSFQVPEGAIYAICGKNGIGKSVLFRILTGFI
ncbi:MAG TPA: ATP-binding cassette domain-containing protein, partial [Anaerolineaceae bacterium]|nr:ATP-binding cassette domain-containing protein [Anaerolineaceae bacterium]